jgi:hypothetical protein
MVVPDGQGMYRRKTDPDEGLSLKPGPRPWTGRTYLLTDAVNSSATFYTARICQELGLATIVGEPTGGNQRGTNGGMMFFLRLPQSGVEMDIPLISYLPDGTRPDAGITPDIYITPDPARVARGEDQALEAVWQLVRTTPAPTALRAETLARAGGLYTGTLGYLDYTAGTWETLPLTASWVADGTKFHLRATFYEWGGLIRQHYVYRVQNGKFSSSGPWDIVSYTEDTARHAYQLVITRPGRDGNQRRRCTFRQTMTWDDTYMILTKEVRFEGEADFFKRNEYNLRRL